MSGPTGCRVIYAGPVQGVGFRATAATLAQEYPVSGWVRNLPGGTVELFAQGERAEVEAFLDAIRRYWGDTIEDESAEWRAADPLCVGFKVVR